MNRSFFFSLALIVLASSASAQWLVPEVSRHLLLGHLSFSVQEGAELQLGLLPKPGRNTTSDAMVTWIVTLKAPSGDIVGSGEVEAAVGGLAVFEVTIDATSRSQQTETGVVQIVMNDQVIGTTEVQNGRIILRAEVEQTEFGRNPATGETINIRAKNYGRFIVSTVFDFATKATRAVEAHTVGQADWTTLEVPGLTSQ
jgi:hypothetical protein